MRSWHSQIRRKLNAKDCPVLVVQRQSRRGDEFLYFYFQEFEGLGRQSLRRVRAWSEGNGDGGEVPDRRTRIPCAERRATLHFLRGHFLPDQLRDAAGS